MTYAKIRIENLGPIREGEFELRPLTIFIGPNNSGKTYAATAAYAMVNGLRFDREARSQQLNGQRFRLQGGHYVTVERDAIDQPAYGRILLPVEIESQVWTLLDGFRRQSITDVASGFLDAFGTENLAFLKPEGVNDLCVSLIDASSGSLGFRVKSDQIETQVSSGIGNREQFRLSYVYAEAEAGTRLHDSLWADVIAKQLWADDLTDLGLPVGSAIYLPSGRLGIIQSWPVLASSAIGALRQRASRVRDDLAPVPGVLADYLQRLILLATRDKPRSEYPYLFRTAGELLESEVLQGRIVREFSPLGVMRLIYRTDKFDLPLDRASSMVADLASLAIALKDQLADGDLLVMDEPESHLYPENERAMAKVLARVARGRVRVLVPTHSSTFVHQISNIVRSGFLTDEERHSLGFTDDDRLAPDDVGLYQFKLTNDGTVIEEIQYDPEFGFAEEGFYEVAESISDESYEIESRLPVTVQ